MTKDVENADSFNFSAPIQIRMSDLDPFAHVNNGVQCNYFDCGRSAYFEHVFNQQIDWTTLDLVLAHVELDFLKPIGIHDSIRCESKVYAMGNKSFKMIQQLRDTHSGDVKTVCHSVLVSIDRQTGATKPVDETYRKAIMNFETIFNS